MCFACLLNPQDLLSQSVLRVTRREVALCSIEICYRPKKIQLRLRSVKQQFDMYSRIIHFTLAHMSWLGIRCICQCIVRSHHHPPHYMAYLSVCCFNAFEVNHQPSIHSTLLRSLNHDLPFNILCVFLGMLPQNDIGM